jgi:uncharacterized protein (DUF302 family)
MSLSNVAVRGPCDTTGCPNEAKVHYGLEEFYCLDCHAKHEEQWKRTKTLESKGGAKMSADLATRYAMKREMDIPVPEAEEWVRLALGEEGFGVLTEIDVTSVFKEKLGESFRPYRILGVCTPSLAHQALTAEIDIGLLLPCNVVVYEGEREGTSVVAAIDPVAQLGIAGREDLRPMAEEVKASLERVLAAA